MVATFVAYWPAMRNSFVWDDTALILRDPLIRHWKLTPTAFKEFLFLDATASNFYRPIQRLTFTADYALWGIARDGANAAKTNAPKTGDGEDLAAIQKTAQPGWHFTSILIHALAAVALWRLLRIWLGDNWWSLLGALAWAVHPLHTSAITYVSGRADPLAALFAFTGLALVAAAHKSGGLQKGDRPASWRIMGAAACALLALLSKESGVAALTLWLMWLIFKARKSGRAWAAWGASVLIVVAVYLTLRDSANFTPVPESTRTTSLATRPVLAATALGEYARLFAAPHSLHMERDISSKPGDDPAKTTIRWVQLGVGVLVLLGLLIWARWAMRNAPDAALAIACFAITWLPISNLFKLNATIAEHWLYVPSAFLLAAIAATIGRASQKPRPVWPAYVFGAWILFLCVQTFLQQSYWKDQRTFVEQTAQRAGNGPRMLVNLGQLAAMDGDNAKALDYYRKALEKDPELSVAHFNIAAIALREKDYDTALASLAKAETSPLFDAAGLLLRASIIRAQTGVPQFNLLAQAAGKSQRNWDILRRYPETLIDLGKHTRAYHVLLNERIVGGYRAELWQMKAFILDYLGQEAAKAGNPKLMVDYFKTAVRAYEEATWRDMRDDYSRQKLEQLRPLIRPTL